MSLTRVAHELSGDFLVAAAAAEDLATQSAVVAAAEGCELLIAVVTLFTLAVWHPVLLQIAVLKGNNNHCFSPQRGTASVQLMAENTAQNIYISNILRKSVFRVNKYTAKRVFVKV